jgi:hypothetical protein
MTIAPPTRHPGLRFVTIDLLDVTIDRRVLHASR